MKTRLAILLPALCAASLLATPLTAQEPPDMSPAKELKKLEPLIGNWAGSGVMNEPSGQKSPWTAKATCQWALNNHFVQEDWEFKFDGLEGPIVYRNYLGWDKEGERYVRVITNNVGQVMLTEMNLLPDGSMLQFMHNSQAGMPYTERRVDKIDGDTMTIVTDMLMPMGKATMVIDGKLKRCEEAYEVDWGEDAFMEMKPHEQLKKVGVIRGQYELKGEMVMEPGKDALGITGTDWFSMVWGGTVMRSRTEGHAEGAPGTYESHAFWGWDAKSKCMRAAFVSNMGEVGEMLVHWVENDLVSTGTNTIGGVPMTQRYTMKLGRKGELKSVVGTTLFGAMEPFVSFKATYRKQH